MSQNFLQILAIINFFFLGFALLAVYYYGNRLRYELRRSEVLREIAHRYQAFVDATSEGIFRCDLSGQVVIMNHAGAHLLGFESPKLFFESESAGYRFYETLLLETEKKERLFETGNLDKEIVTLNRNVGSSFFAEITVNVMKTEVGEAYGIEGIFRDVTQRIAMENRLAEYREHLEDMVRKRTAELEASNIELAREIEVRKKAEVDLRFSEETARALLNAPTDMAMLVDTRGRILSANEAAAMALKKPVEELVGLRIYDFLKPDLQKKYKILGRETIRSKSSVRTEEKIDSNIYMTTIYPIVNERNRVERSAVYTSDITKRRQAEMVLKEYHEHLEELVAERTREIAKINDQLRSELDRRQAAEKALKKYSENLEEMVKDATEEILKLERREFQLEKLAAVGQATSTVVHEIRNPLSSIKMGLTTLMGRAKLQQHDQKCLEVAKREVVHLEKMLRDILDFGKPQTYHFVSQDINTIVGMTAERLKDELFAQQVEIQLKLAKTLPEVQYDSDRMGQVLRNLMLNAGQAMSDGGQIQIQTLYLKPENLVEITVADNGPGMEEDTVAHIFEPFFSTKSGGTGLGLPLVEKIITAHNGTIQINSKIDKGTSIRMTLPV